MHVGYVWASSASPVRERQLAKAQRLSVFRSDDWFGVLKQGHYDCLFMLEGLADEVNILQRQVEGQVVTFDWPSVVRCNSGMRGSSVPAELPETLRVRDQAFVSADTLHGRQIVEAPVHGLPNSDRYLMHGHRPKVLRSRLAYASRPVIALPESAWPRDSCQVSQRPLELSVVPSAKRHEGYGQARNEQERPPRTHRDRYAMPTVPSRAAMAHSTVRTPLASSTFAASTMPACWTAREPSKQTMSGLTGSAPAIGAPDPTVCATHPFAVRDRSVGGSSVRVVAGKVFDHAN